MKKLKLVWKFIGIIYYPIYCVFWLLHKVARVLLAISYYGMLNKRIGNDIIKYLFTRHGKY